MASNAGMMRSNVKNENVSAPSPMGGQWPPSGGTTPDPDFNAGSAGGPTGLPSAVSHQSQSSQQQHAVDKRRLQNLISEVDPLQQVDEEAESCLLDVADDFIDSVLAAACQVAKHRKSPVLEVKDVQYVLDTQYNLWMPGTSFGGISDTKQAYKRSAPTESHKQRVAIIKKIFKTH